MGENKHIEELDAFAKKYVKEIKQEKAPLDFTASVMQQVLKESQIKRIPAKELISKKGWFVIIASVLALVFIPYQTTERNIFNLPEIDFSFLNKFQFSNLFESVTISNAVALSVILFGVFFAVQVLYIKNHFQEKYQ